MLEELIETILPSIISILELMGIFVVCYRDRKSVV